MPVGGPRSVESLKRLLEYLQIGMPQHGPRTGGEQIGVALGQGLGGAADVGGDLLKGFKDIMAGVQQGYGGPQAPKPTLAGPTERAILPGPKVSEAAPRKVPGITGLGQQPVQTPKYPQVPIQQMPASGLDLGGTPASFQGLGSDLDMPDPRRPGMGERSLDALKRIFGLGGAVDWEFNIPDTGVTLAPGQTRAQRGEALAGRMAEAGIAGKQAGTLRDLSQAGVYEMQADPDFQRLKMMIPYLMAQLTQQGRASEGALGREATKENIYLREGLERGRPRFGQVSSMGGGRAVIQDQPGGGYTFQDFGGAPPTGGDLMRNAIAIRQQYDKIAEVDPEAAERFRASMVAADPRLAAYLPPQPAPEPSWLDRLMGR